MDLHGDERYTADCGNYLDWLMSMDPLSLSAQNIDDIIVTQRRARLSAESGIKPKKGPGAAISLDKIGLAPKPVEIKRRKF